MADPIYKGNCAVQEQVGSGENANGNIITLKYKGKDDGTFDSTVPELGDTVTVDGVSWRVTTRRKTPGKGGLAEAVLTLKPQETGTGSGSGAISATFEIEMAQIEKPLLSHPMFTDDPDYSGDCVKHIDAWRNSPAEVRNNDEYVTGVDEDGEVETADLTDSEKEIAELIRKGVESYLVFAPVVTKTADLDERPDVGKNCGKRCAPEITADGDWEYLKTGDRAVQRQDGAWQRIEQWTGADEWSELLYEEGTND